MKKIIFIISIFSLVSCGQVDDKSGQKSVSEDSITENVVDSIVKVDINPSFMVTPELSGTDFGNFFKTLYLHGKFSDMLAFTSTQSVEKFGEDVILDFYENDLKFGYDIGEPRSQNIDGDIITLNYEANIIATKRVVRISVVVENDSCKVVLPNKLTDFPS